MKPSYIGFLFYNSIPDSGVTEMLLSETHTQDILWLKKFEKHRIKNIGFFTIGFFKHF